jgi:hypothetical protein
MQVNHIAQSDASIIQATHRDRVNITVYGNPVLDVIVNVAEGAAHLSERDAIEKVAMIRSNGNLEFTADSYIGFDLMGETIIWGPFNAANQEDRYLLGQKYKLRASTTDQRPTHQPGGKYKVHVSRMDLEPDGLEWLHFPMLPSPTARIGGGGPNVLFGFYDVFAQLKVELIGTVEKRPDDMPSRLDRFIKPLTDRIGLYTEIPVYDRPGINLAIEGLGYERDRIIFTAELPTSSPPLDALPAPQGRAIMVNTLYTPQIAFDALAYACSADRLGLLALTKPLCSKTSLSPRVVANVLSKHKSLRIDSDAKFSSVHDFVRRFVLSRGHCITVMNEDELGHLVEMQTCMQHGEINIPTLGKLIDGLRAVRSLQGGNNDRIYVTAGPSGSLVLDEENEVTYCGTIEDPTRPPTGKTAIGDTYATFLLALETIGNYIRPYNIPARDVLKAAAAGADTGVYHGFGNLAVNKVNNYLGDRKRRVVSLGRLDTFPCDRWREVGIPEMRASDWDSVSRLNYMETSGENLFIPSTLQEVLGRAFLRL